MKTLVIGASTKSHRYSYKAVTQLRKFNHEVVAIGIRDGEIGDVKIITGRPDLQDIHTITLYVNPEIQETYIDYLISLKPKRIIFNPGAENLALYNKAKEDGIEAINACTLVMLNTGQYA